MQLLFLYGKPGTGKLTVARALCQQRSLKLFHNHLTVDLVGAVFDFGTAAFTHLRQSIWLQMLDRAAAEKVDLVFTFAPEATVAPDVPAQVAETVRGHGGDTLFVELYCDPATLRTRVAAPQRRQYGKLTDPDFLDQLERQGQLTDLVVPPGCRHIAIDNTHLSPEQAADRIADALTQERN
ncbi:MAG: shikimate kinase [Candidatus Latescibacteria bacterium]|nr:shikimate kinase [Candidatus Latescibacterota bacterium]